MEADSIAGGEDVCEMSEHDQDKHIDSADDSLTPGGTDTEHTLAPDGGWGWVVCCACFMSHVLTDGIFYSFGVMYVELLDYFNGSKGETAIIASLSTGVCFLVGPVVAMLANRFGCRVIASIGTILTSCGLVLSIFAPNIQFLYFSLGALVGVDPLKASFLVSTVGITNTFGRVLFGFLSDRKCVNRMMLYAIALVICGTATCVTPLLASYEMLMVYSVLFGLFSGVTISLTSVLLADIVGIDRLADALGVSTFFAGITSFLGPPIAGWMYDVSGNYLASYISAGAAIVLSGAMLFVVPCIEHQSK